MGRRGPKPKRLVDTEWSANLAYAIGLLATDGCIGKDGLWIDLTSKDREQLENFCKCIGVNMKIGTKDSGSGRTAWRVQMKNKIFYDFLLSIGFTPSKSLTLKKISIPDKYFFDFLRGCFDGDGCTYSYWDPRWRSSFMIYTCFVSASKSFLLWIRQEVENKLNISGHIYSTKKVNVYYQLKYAKNDSLRLLKRLYYGRNKIHLKRKKLKIDKALASIGMSI
jgi:hypothetical protein